MFCPYLSAQRHLELWPETVLECVWIIFLILIYSFINIKSRLSIYNYN